MKVKTILNGFLAGMIVTIVGAITLMAMRGGKQRPLVAELPKLSVVPDFTLTNAAAAPVTNHDLHGKVWLASFIFTRCAGACPILVHRLKQTQTELPQRDDLKLVSFSVDPDWDKPAVLAKYAAEHELDPRTWWLLTGDKAAMYDLVSHGFKLAISDEGGTEEEPVTHSTKVALIDRNGIVRGYYDSTDTASLEQLVRDVRDLLAEKS